MLVWCCGLLLAALCLRIHALVDKDWRLPLPRSSHLHNGIRVHDDRCRFIWREKVLRVEWAYRQLAAKRTRRTAPGKYRSDFFDLAEPVYSCEFDTRVGRFAGDGAKFVCAPQLLRPDCVVYSFGCDGDIDFEVDLQGYQNCTTIVFDPTGSSCDQRHKNCTAAEGQRRPWPEDWWFHTRDRLRSVGIRLEPLALGDGSPILIHDAYRSDWRDTVDFHRLLSMFPPNERVIDVLKMDVERAEWLLYEDMFKTCAGPRPQLRIHMLLIELHQKKRVPPNHTPEAFIHAAAKCGLIMFHKEPNVWDGKGSVSMEFSFISIEWAYEVYRVYTGCTLDREQAMREMKEVLRPRRQEFGFSARVSRHTSFPVSRVV